MRLIDRYAEAVIRQLPVKMREDVKKELIGNIENMIEERAGGHRADDKIVADVLYELGNPRILADTYLNKEKALIGPRYMPTYLIVLKIVIFAVIFGLIVAMFVRFLSIPASGRWNVVLDTLVASLSGLLQAGAWVTLIFAVAETTDKTIKNKNKNLIFDWNIDKLPKQYSRSPRHNLAEGIIGLIGSVLGFILFNYALSWLGVYVFEQDRLSQIIPIFNMTNTSAWVPLLSIVFALSFFNHSIRIVIRRETLLNFGLRLILMIVSLGITVYIFSTYQIFNENLARDILTGNAELETLWANIQNIIGLIIALFGSIDIILLVIRSFKEGINRK